MTVQNIMVDTEERPRGGIFQPWLGKTWKAMSAGAVATGRSFRRPPHWFERAMRAYRRHWSSLWFVPDILVLGVSIVAVCLLAVVVVIAVIFNPDYLITDPLSNLGDDSARAPWIFNAGIISISGLILFYLYLLNRQIQSLLEALGWMLMVNAFIFLIFLAIWEQPRIMHHVSLALFWASSMVGGLLWGTGLAIKGRKIRSRIVGAVPFAGLVSVILIPWAPAGLLELSGIVFVTIGIFAVRHGPPRSLPFEDE